MQVGNATVTAGVGTAILTLADVPSVVTQGATGAANNKVDVIGAAVNGAGGQVGTHIRSDDAFSAKTSLRLTINLGPDSVMEPQ